MTLLCCMYPFTVYLYMSLMRPVRSFKDVSTLDIHRFIQSYRAMLEVFI